MSYLEALSRSLGRRGIRGRVRERILLELEDHLQCEPEARLGDPEELSAHFADELGGERARRAALAAFGSLAVVGLAVAVTQASLTSYPDLFSGTSIALAAIAGFCVLAVSQVAFVAGLLALLQSLRLRGRPAGPAAEIDLLRRRTGVALGSGALVALGLALYAVNFWGRLPEWWATLNVAAAGGCALLLALGALAHARAGRITVSGEGGTCDVVDELGPLARPLAPLRGRPHLLAVLVGAAVVLAMLAGAWYAEGSAEEGLLRAAFEAVAFATAFLSLGRVLGLHGEGRRA